MIFEIRTSGPAKSATNSVRGAVKSLDPNLLITNLRTIDETLSRRLATNHLTSRFTTALGAAPLLLAAIGLYGVLAYGVAGRRMEIGVRMALGANPAGVIAMILRETGWLVTIGLAVGALLAVGTGRVLANQLYGLSPLDPLTFLGAIVVLFAVAFLAAFLPALRASRLDPIIALRQE